MFKIGCHLSCSKGFSFIDKQCEFIGANAFQYFVRNPRGSKAKAIDYDDLKKFYKINETKNYKIVAHAPYVLNVCSHNEEIRKHSQIILSEDIQRCEIFSDSYYNFHPGSHTGQGVDIGINQIAQALNLVISESQKTTILLETMAGKGSEIGKSFEEISKILNLVNLKDKVGVCLDTCHVFDAGYDIANNLDDVLEDFDKKIGISKLKVVHLNDSKNSLGSKKDRHEQLGKGKIGLDSLSKIINNKYLKDLIFILETPQENLEGYKQEIELMKSCLEK